MFSGIGARKFLRFFNGNILAVFFLDLNFDRHAVTIPARHIGRIETRQGLAFDNDVFKNFIQRVADVNIAIRIGRAVVQNKLGPAFARFADALIELAVLPLRDPARLTLGEIALHREGGVRQVQSFFIIGHKMLLR